MIELEHVTKRWGGAVAVDDVSLRVETGELLVLLGGSGSGKTTLLRMVNRLLEPTSGTVRIHGEDVARLAPHELRRRIGYAFQRIGLFPHVTVAANVATVPELRGWPASRVRERVVQCLRLVELDPERFSERFPHELSGGEQQRVGVARALAGEPDVLLFDEPFGALDPITRESLQRSFDRLRRELRLTGIFVTHDVLEALLLADRIAVLDRGAMLQVGTPREIARSPADARVAALFESPRRQALAVDRLFENEEDRG
jgi:osmoprotectant transport system ATP-binding protein